MQLPASDLATDPKAYFGGGDVVGEEPMRVAAGSSNGALVVMMEASDLGDLDHAPAICWMNCSVFRAIHLQRLMSSPPVIVVEVAGEDAAQMSLIQHNHVIKAFSTDASDYPLDVGILPRAASSNMK